MGKEKPKRIVFHAGPSCGKSSIAARLFADLKRTGIRVEFAMEHIKSWTFIEREVDEWDQPYLLGRQIQYSHHPLKKGADVVVEESPPELNAWYGIWHNSPAAAALEETAWQYSKIYPTLHVLLERNNEFYDNFGRYHKLDQGIKMDASIKKMLLSRIDLDDPNVHFWTINPKDYDSFYERVQALLELRVFLD